MKVFELMTQLSYKPAGDEVVLYCYGEKEAASVEAIGIDTQGRVAITSDREAFECTDKMTFGGDA